MDLEQVPKNELLLTALHMYMNCDPTRNLKSERNRTIFAEDFETKQVPLLSTLSLKAIAENYKGRPINLILSPIQTQIFYSYIDPHLPIEKCINIDDESYWKRVYCLMCNDKIGIKEKSLDKNTCWKELVINMKYVNVIESTPVEIWILDEMNKLSKLVSPYIRRLEIKKLQAMRESSFRKAAEQAESIEEDLEEGMYIGEEDLIGMQFEEEEEAENEEDLYPVELCHHVDLSIVKNLSNMHTLKIQFLPPELGIHYHKRFFNFSYKDMQNLASGISQLPNLKALIIHRSFMDCIKLSTILESVKTIFVEELELSYCKLDDESGESLYEYLIATSSLKNLNLAGNYFRDLGIEYLAEGIENSKSSLTHLSLSNNPITNEAICTLTEVLKNSKDLMCLNLSGMKNTKPGSICVSNLIKANANLEEVDLTATPMEGFYIIDALSENKNVQKLLCQGCGLTLEEECKIELLLKRNRYIRENPYINDPTKTEEEINAFVSRIKNPILLTALGFMQARTECRQKKEETQIETEQEEIYNIIEEEDDDEDENEYDTCPIDYEADKFTRDELVNRITLFAQTNSDFFMNQKDKSKRCQ